MPGSKATDREIFVLTSRRKDDTFRRLDPTFSLVQDDRQSR